MGGADALSLIGMSLAFYGQVGSQCARLQKEKPSVKLIMAVIKPFKLEAVRESLTAIGVTGMTVTEVQGYGRQKGQTEIYRGAEYEVSFLPKVKVEVAVSSEIADQVIDALATAARTGQIGDGKVFCMDIGKALRIRTNEYGVDAL